jgi:hypothetical protein
MTRDFQPTKATEVSNPMTTKNEAQNALTKFPKAQQDRMKAVAAKQAARADGPPMKLKIKDGVTQITFVHPDPDLAQILMMADLGTCDPAFLSGVQGQIAFIGTPGAKIDEGASNFLLSVVRGVQPRDELEAMLAVQMGAIHQATMTLARRLNHVETIPQQDAAERALNKLARTYTMQMEALKRYRTGGQQKVIVEHVTVNAGKQLSGPWRMGGRAGMKADANPMHLCLFSSAMKCAGRKPAANFKGKDTSVHKRNLAMNGRKHTRHVCHSSYRCGQLLLAFSRSPLP